MLLRGTLPDDDDGSAEECNFEVISIKVKHIGVVFLSCIMCIKCNWYVYYVITCYFGRYRSAQCLRNVRKKCGSLQ